MLVILITTCFPSTASGSFELVSTTVRDNKLYSLYIGKSDSKVQITIYELKNGLISDIFSNRKEFNLTIIDDGYSLVFFDALNELQTDRNKLWLRSEQIFANGKYDNSSFINWIGYINLLDMSLNSGSDLLKFPTFDKFPTYGYAVSTITNVYGSNLYVIGGMEYSKIEDRYLHSNSFYKYNFTTKDWVDMSQIVKVKLELLINHKSLVIDNRYLLVLGGKISNNLEKIKHLNYFTNRVFKTNSIYNLWIFDTFVNNWDNIRLNSNVFDAIVKSLDFDEFIAKVYKDKFLVLGGRTGQNGAGLYYINSHIGTLDIKSKSWSWNPIIKEDDSNYNPTDSYRNFLVFNDQLIITSNKYGIDSELPIKVYDLQSQRMISTLRLSNTPSFNSTEKENENEQGQSKLLPTYVIVIISVIFAIFGIAFGYLLYRKIIKKSVSNNAKSKNSAPIREIWSNIDEDNTINIIMGDKNKGKYINNKNPNTLNSILLDPISDTHKTDIIEFNK